ncbi:nitroreductase family protein [Candidatus Altiarchaeota archaeon]
MDVEKSIEKRRAYRSLDPVEITEELVMDLSKVAQLAPSCFNNQPWRFVFVYDKGVLEKVFSALPDGNNWAKAASMVIVVFSKKEEDCVIGERIYHQFDVGMATAFIILRATELGLVAHPIAGYDPVKVSEVVGIPGDYQVITLVIVGKHSEEISSVLSEKQAGDEVNRPKRKSLDEITFMNKFEKKE